MRHCLLCLPDQHLYLVIHLSTFLFLFLGRFLTLPCFLLLQLFFPSSIFGTPAHLVIDPDTKCREADQECHYLKCHFPARPFFLKETGQFYDSVSFAAAVSIGVLIALNVSLSHTAFSCAFSTSKPLPSAFFVNPMLSVFFTSCA
jgi:hypothetical protein